MSPINKICAAPSPIPLCSTRPMYVVPQWSTGTSCLTWAISFIYKWIYALFAICRARCYPHDARSPPLRAEKERKKVQSRESSKGRLVTFFAAAKNHIRHTLDPTLLLAGHHRHISPHRLKSYSSLWRGREPDPPFLQHALHPVAHHISRKVNAPSPGNRIAPTLNIQPHVIEEKPLWNLLSRTATGAPPSPRLVPAPRPPQPW